MTYVADDGKKFDNEKDCLKYESQLNKQAEKVIAYKDLMDKKKAYESAKQDYEDANRKFFQKYYSTQAKEAESFAKLVDWMLS